MEMIHSQDTLKGISDGFLVGGVNILTTCAVESMRPKNPLRSIRLLPAAIIIAHASFFRGFLGRASYGPHLYAIVGKFRQFDVLKG